MPPVAIPWTKLPFVFDPVGLQEDLQSIPSQAWVPHFNPQDYSGEWSSVALRSRSGRADDITAQGAVEDFHDTPLAAQCPHLWAAVEAFELPLKSVRLLRLHAGSRVREHCDRDLRLDAGELRIHIPVATNKDVEFIVANRRLELGEGEAWYIDFSQPHRIDNRGDTDRTHLIIDGTLNDWAIALLQRALSEVVTESFEPERMASLRRFREQVLNDEGLQTELLKITDREKFLDAVVGAGRERGFAFELSEVESEFNERRRGWVERSVSA